MLRLKSFRRFDSFLYIFAVIGIAFVSSAYPQFQIEAKYVESLPKPPKVSSAKIRLDDETQSPHTLVGGYYTIRNGLESKLLLNNKAPQPIEVQPTLYSKNGAILQIPPITIEPTSSQFVNLRDWASIGGESFQEGSIKLFHRG